MQAALHDYLDVLPEVFPEPFLAEHGLWPLRQALAQLHFPANQECVGPSPPAIRVPGVAGAATGLGLAAVAGSRIGPMRLCWKRRPRSTPAFAGCFPSSSRADQQRAIGEVAADMARPQPMNRLLQGDVGSGKTVVAVYALLLAVAHRQQAVLMAPTEILARQHAATLGMVLSESHVRWACLTSGSAGGRASHGARKTCGRRAGRGDRHASGARKRRAIRSIWRWS